MNKFKIGDKVKINVYGLFENDILTGSWGGLKNGDITTVIGYKDNNIVLVENDIRDDPGFWDKHLIKLPLKPLKYKDLL